MHSAFTQTQAHMLHMLSAVISLASDCDDWSAATMRCSVQNAASFRKQVWLQRVHTSTQTESTCHHRSEQWTLNTTICLHCRRENERKILSNWQYYRRQCDEMKYYFEFQYALLHWTDLNWCSGTTFRRYLSEETDDWSFMLESTRPFSVWPALSTSVDLKKSTTIKGIIVGIWQTWIALNSNDGNSQIVENEGKTPNARL